MSIGLKLKVQAMQVAVDTPRVDDLKSGSGTNVELHMVEKNWSAYALMFLQSRGKEDIISS